jgi:RNA polymerase sigma-70 factor (ECF subfamily)
MTAGEWESDQELVGRLLSGDEEAFDRFFRAAYPALYRFALARLDHDTEGAGEVAQAALCKGLSKLRTFRGEATLLTWLYAFCRRELYAHRVRNQRFPQVEFAEDDPEVRAALDSLRAVASASPEHELERSRLAGRVRQALEALPSHYADALEWKYIDGLAVREIGMRLGLGAKAAESLLTRARRAFRDAFGATAAGHLLDATEG